MRICWSAPPEALGAKTYSAAVNRALEEVERIQKIRGLAGFYGQGLWSGDLADMREDAPAAKPRSKKSGKAR